MGLRSFVQGFMGDRFLIFDRNGWNERHTDVSDPRSGQADRSMLVFRIEGFHSKSIIHQ